MEIIVIPGEKKKEFRIEGTARNGSPFLLGIQSSTVRKVW